MFKSLISKKVLASTASLGIVLGIAGPITRTANADGGATAVMVEIGGKIVQKKLEDAVRSLTSEHTRYYPNGRTLILPMGDVGGTRASFNFNHRSWVPRGSQPVQVKILIHGVPPQIRDSIRLMMKADKPGRDDKDRLDAPVKHGDTFTLKYGTSGDAAYYFVERGTNLRKLLPQGAYIELQRLTN